MITFIKRKRWSLALLGCLFLLLSGCNTRANPSSINYQILNQSQWTLTKSIAPSTRPITLAFDHGRMSGFNGCNSYSGSYIASEDGTLALGQPSISRMLCLGTSQQLEQDYMAKLAQVRMYALARGQLILLDGHRKTLLTFQTHNSN